MIKHIKFRVWCSLNNLDSFLQKMGVAAMRAPKGLRYKMQKASKKLALLADLFGQYHLKMLSINFSSPPLTINDYFNFT